MNNTQCGIRDSRDTGFDCYPGSEIRQNLGTDAGLGKKTIFGTVADPDLEITGRGGEGVIQTLR